MASDHERLRALKDFDDTMAGVKGLVDAGVTTIPAIFHQPPDSFTPLAFSTDLAIPIIDLSGRRSEVVSGVKMAAETLGFFLVVNHGVPEATMSKMLAAVRCFNDEPTEAKGPYYTRDERRHVRYSCNGDLFQAPAAKWRDSLFMDDAEQLAVQVLPRACRDVIPEYTRLMRRLGRMLLGLLSEAVGMPPGYLEEEVGCMEALNIAGNYYPGCPEPHLTLGAIKHSDAGFLTVLLRDGVIGGLHMLIDDDKQPTWVEVPEVPGALVVNIGDFLQFVSNDRFKSVVHRVVSNRVGPRVSVACFFMAKGIKVYTPVVVDGSGPPHYRSATGEELLYSTRTAVKLQLPSRTALNNFRL